MLRPGVKLGLTFCFCFSMSYAPCAAAQAPASSAVPQGAATTSQPSKPAAHRHTGKSAKKKQPEPEVVQTPPPPPTPEQLPPAQPNVSYQNGQLTIQSDNSTLAQILRSVQAKTGGSFEIPGSANNDRVVAQLGPGPARDVLNSLLNGSKYDYIILGISGKPGAVQKVILTQRPSASTTPVNSAQAAPPSGMQSPAEVQPEDDNSYVPEPPPEENTAEQNGQPSFVPGQPMQPGGLPNGNAPVVAPGTFQPGQAGQQGVKTPEQLLQELQRMQQQQQQYQQQLNPANQPPGEQPQQQ